MSMPPADVRIWSRLLIGIVRQRCKVIKLRLKNAAILDIDLNAPRIERELMRRELQCRIFPIGFLERYKYTVICAAYQGKWLLSRHRQRSTWKTQGGHIEAGETPLACAKRELFEESGVRDAEIYPVCDYWGFDRYGCSNGMVFLAVVYALGELPESEMKEIRVFDALPAELTYPETTPKLLTEAAKMLEALTAQTAK